MKSSIKRSIKTILIVIIAAQLILLSGCGLFDNGVGTTNGDTFPMTIVDDANREVTVHDKPERIVSFAPAHTETLFALDLQDYIVGIDDYSDYPVGTQDIQKAGDALNPNYEVIMELAPDIVFTVGTEDSPLVERLDELGITCVVLQAESLQSVFDDMLIIGRLTGKTEEAEALVNELLAQVNEIENRVKDLPEEDKVTVFYELSPPGTWGLWTIGPDSFIHDLIQIAGGINVAGEEDGDYFSYSEEMLIEKDPMVIITPNPQSPGEIEEGNRPSWETIEAVRSKRVYLVDQDVVSRPGPRVVTGLKEISKALYPKRE